MAEIWSKITLRQFSFVMMFIADDSKHIFSIGCCYQIQIIYGFHLLYTLQNFEVFFVLSQLLACYRTYFLDLWIFVFIVKDVKSSFRAPYYKIFPKPSGLHLVLCLTLPNKNQAIHFISFKNNRIFRSGLCTQLAACLLESSLSQLTTYIYFFLSILVERVLVYLSHSIMFFC